MSAVCHRQLQDTLLNFGLVDDDEGPVDNDLKHHVQLLGEEADGILETIRDGSFFVPTPRLGQQSMMMHFANEDDDDGMKEDLVRLSDAVCKIREDLAACAIQRDVHVAVGETDEGLLRPSSGGTCIRVKKKSEKPTDRIRFQCFEVEQHEEQSLVQEPKERVVRILVALVGFLHGSFRWFLA